MQQTEATYRNKFAISQSSIKDWKELSPSEWYNKWILRVGKKKKTKSLDFGSLLDTKCFTPKDFKKRFIVSDIPVPSEKIAKIVTEVFEHLNELNENINELNSAPAEACMEKINIPSKKVSLVDNKEVVLKFAKENDYYVNKPEQAYNTVIEKGSAYFEFMKKAGNKIVITKDQEALAMELRDILYTNEVSKGFFAPKKGCDVVFQVQIFTDFEIVGLEGVDSIPVKGMVDIVHFNHKREEVREVDLKYTNNAYRFNSWTGPVRMFDYPSQHSFYDYLIPRWLETYEGGKYKHYRVMNPLNVVIDDVQKLPYLYEYNSNDLYVKRYGIENTQIRGWEDTLNEIAWHLDKNDWGRPREHILNGRMQINIYKK